jgi:hypothetical protein
MGGSQFTMTLWMGYSQTTKNDNGDDPPTPAGWRGAGSDQDGTRNMSRAVHLLYLVRYQIGGDFVST